MVGVQFYRLDTDGALLLDGANAAADTILGVSHAALIGRGMEEAFPVWRGTEIPARCRQVAAGGGEFNACDLLYAQANREGVLQISAIAVGPERVAVMFHDITACQRAEAERERLLLQLTQVQKLEFVGRLAGGVVHDFNNLLHGIMGQVELCRDELGSEHPVRGYLDEIASEAQRSARLVRQLLTFVRRQDVAPQMLDVNESLAGMLKMLQRLLGEDIELVWLPGGGAGAVRMDPSQFDQILANLAVNARDAIHGVGRLTIVTRPVVLSQAFVRAQEGCAPGPHVLLAVQDTGCGMDAETQRRMFEPFFSTKPEGEGSGLGLATVQRIVRQNHGCITVQSAPGEGTCFEIYLPQHEAPARAEPQEITAAPAGGSETILLVEDDKVIRFTTRRLLQKSGYTVLAAETPEEALREAAAHGRPIHLLLTDVVLPGMTGRDLAARLVMEVPGLKCLYMSGHTADVIARRGRVTEEVYFIAKPFTRETLVAMVRAVLDERA
jgi:signal transduction histidine kinase/ActR/RegA family two-component response regulator